MAGIDDMTDKNNAEIEELTLTLAHLDVKIKEITNTKPKPSLEYEDIVNIYEKEISSLKDFLDFEDSLTLKFIDEENRTLKYIEEEKQLVMRIEDYLERKKDAVIIFDECVMDQRNELFYKLEVLHRQLTRLIKTFTRRYFPKTLKHKTNDLFLSGNYSDKKRENQKSLLDILRELIIELGSENKTGILKIDETVPHEYIDLLMCANVITFHVTDPSLVMLKESNSNKFF